MVPDTTSSTLAPHNDKQSQQRYTNGLFIVSKSTRNFTSVVGAMLGFLALLQLLLSLPVLVARIK